jgi:hypothetical protein
MSFTKSVGFYNALDKKNAVLRRFALFRDNAKLDSLIKE